MVCGVFFCFVRTIMTAQTSILSKLAVYVRLLACSTLSHHMMTQIRSNSVYILFMSHTIEPFYQKASSKQPLHFTNFDPPRMSLVSLFYNFIRSVSHSFLPGAISVNFFTSKPLSVKSNNFECKIQWNVRW